MKRILSSFAAAALLAVLAACASTDDGACNSKLNEPGPGADQDPGYAKVTTPALSQNFVQRIAEKKQQAEKEGKDIKLVLVGDSITHFWEGGGMFGGFGGGFGGFGGFGGGFGGFGGGFGGGAPGGAAPGGGQNAQPTQNSWSELAVYHPLNLGFSGDRTENILHVVKNEGIFELIDPQLVTVMIGTNNFGMHESEPAATAEAIRLIVLAIKEKAPNAKILLYGIFPRGDGLGDKCAATNEIIKDFADNKTVFYEDLTPKFTDEQGNLIQGVMNFDRLHPAEPGYKIWGDSIKAFADQHNIK